jgi:hypothetical protein
MIDTYLNQIAYRKKKLSYDRYGKPVLDSKNAFKCRVQGTKSRAFTSQGREYIETPADLEMWVSPSTKFVIDDGIYFETNNYRVINIVDKRNFSGSVEFYKLLLQLVK